jgi:hypothetical protein
MKQRYRQMTDKEKLRVYELRRKDRLSFSAIAEELSNEAEDGRKFDRATIYRVCKNLPDSPLDEPFQWQKLEEYGIPWEASGFLLSLWHGIWERKLVESTEEAERITAREVLWAWRVHLAAPDISPAHTLMWARRFAGNEIGHLVSGMELNFEGLYQALAYRDFEGEAQAEIYGKALEEGRVKPAAIFAGWLPPRKKEGGQS